jgi:hypothetical protein
MSEAARRCAGVGPRVRGRGVELSDRLAWDVEELSAREDDERSSQRMLVALMSPVVVHAGSTVAGYATLLFHEPTTLQLFESAGTTGWPQGARGSVSAVRPSGASSAANVLPLASTP